MIHMMIDLGRPLCEQIRTVLSLPFQKNQCRKQIWEIASTCLDRMFGLDWRVHLLENAVPTPIEGDSCSSGAARRKYVCTLSLGCEIDLVRPKQCEKKVLERSSSSVSMTPSHHSAGESKKSG